MFHSAIRQSSVTVAFPTKVNTFAVVDRTEECEASVYLVAIVVAI